ncbi:MAG: zinc metallopeptidase [Blastochloris sp.]|nr:zinc metallopeptidase [Blastochloris sp.]
MILFIAIFVVTMAISLYAAAKVKSTYAKYSEVPAGSGYTGARCAARILEAAGIDDVEIVESNEFLGDHYDPMHKRLVLSSNNFHGNSASALGVAAHECGHAIQHKIAYKPLTWRMASVGVTNYANQVITWLPLIGLFTGGLGGVLPFGYDVYLMLMAGGWGIMMLFNLVTLPVEFDASKRATTILNRMSFLGSQEAETGVRKVLDAAALTYVAAFITSLLYMLYYLLPLLLRRD